MSYRHLDEIDKAVVIGRKAMNLGHLQQPERLTRFLYQRWYLGLSSQQVGVPPQRLNPWQAWGKRWTDDDAQAGSKLVRLYLSCAPHTALHAITLVTQRAESWEVPWRLTSTAINAAVPRCDGTVLYLPVDVLDDLRGELARLVDDVSPFLASAVPALTLRIGRGASLAQNPADGRSFGEHRCGLVARSVLEHRGVHHRRQVEETMRIFDEEGIDPRRPYLEKSNEWDRGWVRV